MTTDIRRFEIVLAEDSPEDADLVRMALREHHVPCTLLVIRDGAKAIELIDHLDADPKTPPLDLCLLDMDLPKYDGVKVLAHLRATERYAQTPVIVVTGLDSPQTEAAAMKHAAMAYFRKPSTVDDYMQLGVLVRNLLERPRGTAA